MSDANRLASLGYKQELSRNLTRLTNYGMTLSVVSITSGITSLFAYGLITGGPVVMLWGWIVVSILTLCVSLGLAEICSSYPTAGGLYFWSANLVPEEYKSIVSWFTAWFNLMGQVAGVTSVDFGLSMLIGSILSIGFVGWSPSRWHIVLIHLLVLISHALFNSLGRRVLTGITYISTWWQLIAPLIVSILLFARGKNENDKREFLFTEFVNLTGWKNSVYVILIGLLQAQFCLSGYDAAAHMSEETKRADIAGPWGMVTALIGSAFLGWFFLASLLFGINDYQGTVHSQGGFPVTQILLDNFGRQWTLVLMCMLLVACWLCGLLTVTANSRMIYAFSRDNALPWSSLWCRIDPRLSSPIYAVYLSCFVAFVLSLPYLINSTAYLAVISLCTISLYVSYGLPLLCKVFSPKLFSPGPFHLGRYSPVINIIALVWISFIVVLFVLPPEYPVTAVNMNYASLGFGTLLLTTSLVYLFSARHWFKGPRTNIPTENQFRSSDYIVT